MRRTLFFLLVSGICLAGCGGTGSDSDTVLAAVGDRNITVEDYKSHYGGLAGVDRPILESLDEKRSFLDDLINKDVMELASFDALPELTTEQGWRLERFRRTHLARIYKERVVRARVKVSEADIDEAYDHLHRDVFLDGILLPEENMAREMKRRIDEGAGFNDICRDYSIWESSNPENPWELGWSSGGQLSNWEMEVDAWDAAPGAIIGPYLEQRGWWVLRIGESREAAVEESKEAMRSKLRFMVEKPRHLERDKVVQDSVLAVFGAQYPQEGQLLLLEKFEWSPPPEMEGDPMARYNAARAIPIATTEEGAVTAVTFKDGTEWDVAEFLERASWYPTGLFPTGSTVEELIVFLDQVIRDYAFVEAAITYGIPSDPEYVELIEDRLGKMRVNYLYHNIVVGPVEPTQTEIMEWFNANRDRYQAPSGYRVALFSSSNRPLMQELRNAWSEGTSFAELRDSFEPQTDDFVYVGDSSWLDEEADPGLDGHLEAVEIGAVAPLFSRGDKVFVIRLLDRRDRRLVSYEEAKELIDEEATTNARDQALKSFLADYRERVGVTINEEALDALVIDPADFPLDEEVTQ